MTYQMLVGVAIAGVGIGVAVAFAAGRRPSLRALGTPAVLLVTIACLALVLLLAGPIAFALFGLT